MNRQELTEFFELTTKSMVEVMKKKNADYAGEGENAFSNFTRVETLGICRTEQGFLTRMTDKLCRVTSFCQNGKLMVKSESVQDTLLDLANYALLMMAYIDSTASKTLWNSLPLENEVSKKEIKIEYPSGVRAGSSYANCSHQNRSFNIVTSDYYCDLCGVKV